ncbi:MAG: hypothetical protein HWN81_21920 [Candidatus Lokiarchaeota archaeon]|nr:hypothetical protein [Candidatus Lokiarchaeota archaeon]
MNVKKISINVKEIIIDIVLCPKTNLYLQSLYCHRCGYFNFDDKTSINCYYKKPQGNISDHQRDELIKIFSEIIHKKEDRSQQLQDKEKFEPKISNEILRAELLHALKKKNDSIKI